MRTLENIKVITEEWSPVLESLGVKDPEKKKWLSLYCHYHTLNEGFTFPQASLLNVPGMGNVLPPNNVSGVQGFHSGTGSGDQFPSLLPIALNIAARTIGFELVSVIPTKTPTGILPYMEYVYANGKHRYGAYPHDQYPGGKGNPGVNTYYDKPAVFMLENFTLPNSSPLTLTVGSDYVIYSGTVIPNTSDRPAIRVKFVGYSRIYGYPIFRYISDGTYSSNTFTSSPSPQFTFNQIFSGGITIGDYDPNQVSNNVTNTVTQPSTVKFNTVQTLTDHVSGIMGEGPNDDYTWTGNWLDLSKPYEPTARGVGEERTKNTLALQMFTKRVDVGTIDIEGVVTIEQIQDLSRQWGIDVISQIQNALINEATQTINKHILSRLYSLGWTNHIQANQSEGINLNLELNPNVTSYSAPTPGGLDSTPAFNTMLQIPQSMFVPPFQNFGGFENLDTVSSRIYAKILAASNLIHQRGRRGPATFVVTNLQIATALQKNSGYSFAPYPNTLQPGNGGLYPVGTIAGMTLYVDPNLRYQDTIVLVGRKGADDEPGVKFMPYLLAETIQTIAEGTMSPKVLLKSRYAIVDAGFYPQTQYLMFYVGRSEADTDPTSSTFGQRISAIRPAQLV